MQAGSLSSTLARGMVRSGVGLMAMWAFLLIGQAAQAQPNPLGTPTAQPSSNASPPVAHGHPQLAAQKSSSSTAASGVIVTKPQWLELTPPQQTILQPLLSSWDSLSEGQKRKWLAVTKNYSAMSTEEQTKLQSRMSEWAGLTTQQRNQARLNYVQAKTLSPTERQAKWRAYQELSTDEKRNLAAKAPNSIRGAAPAVKPAASQHLTVVPTSKLSAKPGQKIAVGTHNVDQKTLLPKKPVSAPVATAPVQASEPTASSAPSSN